MGMQLTPDESAVLYRLLAENTTDVILKTDREGVILSASPAIDRLGLVAADALAGRHLAELAETGGDAAAIRVRHEGTIAGRADADWVEFTARTRDGERRWFAIQMQALTDARGQIYGAVSVMRSIEERKSLEEKLFAAAMTDPLTGLTNRQAFIAMLDHLIESRTGGCLALFDIDHFKAINIQYGQSVGDEVLVIFSDLLRVSMRAQDTISRIGGGSWAVLLPNATPARAQAICRQVIDTLSEISQATGSQALHVTASAGVARIGRSRDRTMQKAELALFLAKAKGRNRLELAGAGRPGWAPPRPA